MSGFRRVTKKPAVEYWLRYDGTNYDELVGYFGERSSEEDTSQGVWRDPTTRAVTLSYGPIDIAPHDISVGTWLNGSYGGILSSDQFNALYSIDD